MKLSVLNHTKLLNRELRLQKSLNMQQYSLTESQKRILRWMVEEIRAGKLDEEDIWILWSFDGVRIVDYSDKVPEIKKNTLDSLQKNGFLICDCNSNNEYRCALTSRAYEAVDSNFESMNIDNFEKVVLAHSSQIITVKEAISRFELSPIIKRFGTWAVTNYGVECLACYYPIELERVDELDWLMHMQDKVWTNMNDFEVALLYARELKKMKQSFCISGKPLKVFLCHGSEDKPAVRQLYYRLLAIGIEPWLDEENLLPGQDWKYEIAKAVRASDVVIVCLSSSSVNKTGFVQREIKHALDVADEKPEAAIFLIPAKLEECVIPDRLSGKQWVNLFQEQGFDRLIKSLQTCIIQQQK